MKKILFLLSIFIGFAAEAQNNNIQYRLILIGDAGELGKQQNGVLSHAAANILKGKTSVFYLGDNIYPTGMGLPGSTEEAATKKLLQSQYAPMRKNGAPVFFIPGNHDWDRMGPKGLSKQKREWEYIDEQKDSLLKVVPANGCPDPTEIKINDNLVVIAFDSEWWLYLYNKNNPDGDCDCKTNDEIINRFSELLYKNRDKIIILADHHPFQSYGHHGGTYIWQDYIFPLTSVKSSLYVPLPGIGLLYPFLRKYFPSAEDNTHPLYRNMVKQINAVFDKDPNVIHASGHEHGLQFIKDEKGIVQVVSGSGAKMAVTRKGKNALYGQSIPGYVTADLMTDKSIRFTYYAAASKTDSTLKQVFTYTKPYVKVTMPVLKSNQIVKADSVTVQAEPLFNQVSALHRFAYGNNYRKEWAAPAKLPVIRIAQIKGGLTPVRFGGAHQTQSLLLRDKEGKDWILSSIEKYPEIQLPEAPRQTFAKSWLQDAMSSQYPYAAVITPVIASAVMVAHTTPVIGWVAPDHRLGFYEKNFAGKICLLEEREPGDSSINSGNMIKQLDKSYNVRIDTVEFFRARLLDWFLGDWDQHEDQWRWIASWKGSAKYYKAVPHDRSEAFYINHGLIPKIASRPYVARFLKGYDEGYKSVSGFFFNDHFLNTRLLTQINHEEWMAIARKFQAELTDEVLERSLRKLPASVYNISHNKLLERMKLRRSELLPAAETYYRFFNQVVDIKATDQSERLVIKDTLNGALNVTIYKPNGHGKNNILFARQFDRDVTREVRIYIAKGDDSIYVDHASTQIKVRIIGGSGHKIYNIAHATRRVNVYEKMNSATFTGKDSDVIDKHLSNDTTNIAYVPTNQYNTLIPLFNTGYNIDEGFNADAGFRYLKQGFRKMPGSIQQFTAGHSFSSDATRIAYKGEWFRAIQKADAEIGVRLNLPNSINYFGRGNGTPFNPADKYSDFYRAKFNYYTADAILRWQNLAGTTSIRIGPSVQYYHLLKTDDEKHLIGNPSLIGTYDSNSLNKDKLHTGVIVNYIDDKRNNQVLPAWGVYVNVKLQGYAGLNTYAKSYFQAIPEATLYTSLDANSTVVFSERVGGGITAGKTTFYQSLFLGGQDNLTGFKQNRFAGQHSFYNNLQARIKLNKFLPYILPGQFGLNAFYDVGRVWVKNEPASAWHNGVGAGAYFSPSDMALLQIKAGYSREGWYPVINFKLTF